MFAILEYISDYISNLFSTFFNWLNPSKDATDNPQGLLSYFFHQIICSTAACALVTVFDEKTQEYYIFSIQQLSKNGRLYGSIKAPGGFIDSGEKAEQAAIRELQEETGLDVNNLPSGAKLDGKIEYQSTIGNGKISLFRIPLIVKDAHKFIHSFRPGAMNTCTQELCGGRYFLINEDLLKDNYLNTNHSDLISNVICERPIDRENLIRYLENINEDQINPILKSQNITSIKDLKKASKPDIVKFVKELRFSLIKNKYTERYMTDNRLQFLSAIQSHKDSNKPVPAKAFKAA